MNNSDKFLPKSFVDELYHNPDSRIFVPDGRPLDTEFLGLEYFAKLKNAVKGKKYPKVKGNIKLISDLCPCPSCSKVIQQFTDMFPYVTLEINPTCITEEINFLIIRHLLLFVLKFG